MNSWTLVFTAAPKAVNAYDRSNNEHQKILYRTDWQDEIFDENLTTSGLTDDEVKIGDIFQIGTVKLQAVHPTGFHVLT